MTIGLVLLAITALLIFFGLGERFLRKIGISNWLAFILTAALVLGVVLPDIRIGSAFSINLGGFLVPVVLVAIFCSLTGFNKDLVRSLLATVAVAGVAVATRMLIMPTSFATVLTASVIVGFVGGAVAYLIGMTRLSTLTAAVAGIVLGDIIVNILYRYVLKTGSVVALGSGGVFDSVVLAAVFGVIIAEAIAAVKRTVNRGRVVRGSLNAEASEDTNLSGNELDAPNGDEEEYSQYFDDDDAV
jgi:hypothetical protein